METEPRWPLGESGPCFDVVWWAAAASHEGDRGPCGLLLQLPPQDSRLEEGLGGGLLDGDAQDFHFAVSGRAFAIITEHFPEIVPKVSADQSVH